MDLDFVSVHKHAKKEFGQYPAIMTSHLVNNPYVRSTVILTFMSVDETLCPVCDRNLEVSFKYELQNFLFKVLGGHTTGYVQVT